WIAQMYEQASQVDHVEFAEFGGIEVVDAPVEPLDRRAQLALGDLEACPAGMPPRDRLADVASTADRPIPCRRIEHIDRHHLGGASAFHLERPESVERADVQTALARKRGGQRDLRHDLARVEEARRDDTGRE